MKSPSHAHRNVGAIALIKVNKCEQGDSFYTVNIKKIIIKKLHKSIFFFLLESNASINKTKHG